MRHTVKHAGFSWQPENVIVCLVQQPKHKDHFETLVQEGGQWTCIFIPSFVTSKTILLEDRLWCHYSSEHTRWTSWSSSNLNPCVWWFRKSCLLRVWFPGLLACSRCIVISCQAILQSKLPSGRKAVWMLRRVKGLLRGSWRGLW